MADAALEFLLKNLQNLLTHHIQLISEVKNHVESLEKDMRYFNAFLRDSTKIRRKDNTFGEVVRSIRDVVYEAEDAIDAFVTQAADRKSKNYFDRAFKGPTVKELIRISKEIEAVRLKVKDIYVKNTNISTLSDRDGRVSEGFEAPIVRQQNLVGFKDEQIKLMGYLKEKTEKLDVISIIGMPGLGKTTIAGKIFRDPTIHYDFPIRIWVYISQEFTKRDIFLTILRELTPNVSNVDVHGKSDQDLALQVSSYLEKGSFLVVMDDVWTAEDWDKLQIAFPNNNQGKIIITSRDVEVAHYANRGREPHMLRFLTEEESWELLKLEVFDKPDCPHQDLKIYGDKIVKQCGGLPLAVVVIGGILAKKFFVSDETRVKNAWKKVSENVNAFINEEDREKRMEKIIALSYDKLPYHLRACFLYFGIFPEDFEIPVWKLIRMWIAEGFIQHKSGRSFEETAESYLDDLIRRNLVSIDKKKSDGRAKTCRIHDMLRDFCKTMAGNDRENFLQEFKLSKEGVFEPQICDVKKCRRICIHTDVMTFISLITDGPHVRSFACFSKEDIAIPPENISNIPSSFKLLRVLEAKPVKFSKISGDFYHLVHLRYITLSCTISVLPSNFSKLWNLQTLIVKTESLILTIKADIWKMARLRHLKTNASAILPKSGKTDKKEELLQTLSTISPQSCTSEFFNRARNLKRLGIRGRLSLLIEGKGEFLDGLVKLSRVEKLKLVNDVFPKSASADHLSGLPQHYKFPPNLKSLTLCQTFLDWSQMSILGLLDNLEVLKLKDEAFTGNDWLTIDGGFRHLEFLRIERTSLITWVASGPGHHFPRLRRLELINCEELEGIPIELAEIPSLQVLGLYHSKSAVGSAKKICDAIKEKTNERNATVFKLSIFPPESSG